VSDYPGAPATVEALQLMQKSYNEMGLKAQADEVKQVLDANKTADAVPATQPVATAAPSPPPPVPASTP